MRAAQHDNPAFLLLLVREGKANDWHSICRYFGFNPAIGTQTGEMAMAIVRLCERGFLEAAPPISSSLSHSDWLRNENPSFRITQKVNDIQQALICSLRDLASTSPRRRLMVSPDLFGDRHFIQVEPADVFVVMPFQDELTPVFEDHITPVCDRLKASVARGDDFFAAGSIPEEIFWALFRASVVVADCTGRNPNVFYEIGIAHALGKRVVLITQNPEDVPFDIKHIRYLHYELTPRGMVAFEESLEKFLEHELTEAAERDPFARP